MVESPGYLNSQLISYRGNKRKLLLLLEEALGVVQTRLGNRKLKILDAFSGSGVCSRFFKRYADLVISNDLQPFATLLAQCYLTNQSDVDTTDLSRLIDLLEKQKLLPQPSGFIERLYAPKDDQNIQPGERVFFTTRNARILDNVCRSLEGVDPALRRLVLGPLMAEVSIHSNTAGHFKSFLKNRETGLGCFGGKTGSMRERFMADITIRQPILSAYECESKVFCMDANTLVRELDEIDVAYFDPPYGSQPYGYLYFMLNLLADYTEPKAVSTVAGVPRDWIRSQYSTTKSGLEPLMDLIAATPTKFVLLSYSNEGKITLDEIEKGLGALGTFTSVSQSHPRFNSSAQSSKHGTRGKRGARLRVQEYVYVLEKQ